MARIDKYTAVSKTSELYSDIHTNLTVHPDTGNLLRSINEDAVKRSIRNLILTNPYERLFQPDIKPGIKNLLFENITPQTESTLKTLVINTIENHEPRAKIIDVDVIGDEYSQSYKITISFYVINKTDISTLSIKLQRVR